MILPLLMMDIPRGAQSNDLRGIAKAKANSVRLTEQVNPRSRGVGAYIDWSQQEFGGLSLLTQGRLHPPRSAAFWARVIPTHAGRTRLRRYPNLSTSGYPRSRGADFVILRSVPP